MDSHCCIWCLGIAEGGHEEHIIPEALGCPPGFVLPGTVVCRKCNNNLAHLDQAVLDEFDFPVFMAGVPRKKGKKPIIRSRGNVLATVEKDGPTYTFNMESYPVKGHDGSHLAGFRGSKRDVRGKFSKQGDGAAISFDVSFGQSPKFVRGITKIAFSSLAYFLGAQTALSSSFNPVREFVRDGIGKRHLLLMFGEDKTYRNNVLAPYVSPTGEYSIALRIACIEFLVDLSEKESNFMTFQSKMPEFRGSKDWCVLPVK
ncbi:MAG: HNH endonuclease [Gallionella sp.]|jgi:hypothetical protein